MTFLLFEIYLTMTFFLDRRDDKTIIKSHTQSGGTGVRTPVMMSSLIILIFLSVELGLVRLILNFLLYEINMNI